MSTYELPIVGPMVDEVVGMAEDNILYKTPLVGGLLKQAVNLAIEAAAFFAVALTLGGGLYFLWPSIAALAPRHLSPLGGGYWSYVLLVLAGFIASITWDFVRDEETADVLHANTRSRALNKLSVPGMLIMLAWLIATYIK